MATAQIAGKLGGDFCAEPLSPGLLDGSGQQLTQHERDVLWQLFQEIGRTWKNVFRDSANLKSSWLEFLEAKVSSPPSYAAEYSSAVLVVEELIQVYGETEAFHKLFFETQIPPEGPATRLTHAKVYVVNEFIRMQVVAGGFRGFGGTQHGRNYNGFVRGSRYNRVSRVRPYRPDKGQP